MNQPQNHPLPALDRRMGIRRPRSTTTTTAGRSVQCDVDVLSLSIRPTPSSTSAPSAPIALDVLVARAAPLIPSCTRRRPPSSLAAARPPLVSHPLSRRCTTRCPSLRARRSYFAGGHRWGCGIRTPSKKSGVVVVGAASCLPRGRLPLLPSSAPSSSRRRPPPTRQWTRRRDDRTGEAQEVARMVEGRRVVEDGEGRITHQQANTTEAPSSNDNETQAARSQSTRRRTLRVYRHPPFKGSREQAARGCHRRVRRVAHSLCLPTALRGVHDCASV